MSDDHDEIEDGLTGTQREAVRLDFLGGSCRSIGDAVGVSRTTVWKWQHLPEYKERIREMHAEADKATLADAQKTRDDALRVVRAGLTRLGRRLARDTDGEMSTSDLASTVRAGLDVYKVTSAQTGISETSRLEHAGSVGHSVDVKTGTATSSLVDQILGEDDDGDDV
jgi:hypothetical protein